MFIPLIMALLPLSSTSRTKMPEPFQSSFVKISPNGVLNYYPDEKGNTIPDFSRVGYHHMDEPVPVYPVSKSLTISKGGIVLCGEGSDWSRTLILATSHTRYNVIEVCGEGAPEEIEGTRTAITDTFVPTGTFCINVANASSFKPGDRIIVFRPGTDEWIHDLMMDRIVEHQGTRQ